MSEPGSIIDCIDHDELLRMVPHRPPILLLDRVTQVNPGVAATGHRRLEKGDPLLEGHFPDRAILPGVLLLEGAAQTALVMMCAAETDKAQADTAQADAGSAAEPRIGYLAQVADASFYATVEPPCDIEFLVTFKRRLRNFTFVETEITRNGQRCAKARLTLAVDGARNDE